MSGNKRTEDFHSIKTRQMTWQNPDGSFPATGDVLTLIDGRGHVEPIPVKNPVPTGTCQSDYLYWDMTAKAWTTGRSKVHIGCGAGATGQGSNAVAIGPNAGQTNQQTQSVAIGLDAGKTGQQANAVAIGYQAGLTGQTASAVAIGNLAGNYGQGDHAIAIGQNAGLTGQQYGTVALGYYAGQSGQQGNSVAIGPFAGQVSQNTNAVAIGTGAGQTNQQTQAVAIGSDAGTTGQQANAVAIGTAAGQTNQQSNAVAIGTAAGLFGQGSNSVAIGTFAGQTNQAANSIVLNAAGSTLDTANPGLYVAPVRAGAGNVMYYDANTKEMSYDISGNITVNDLSASTITVTNGSVTIDASGNIVATTITVGEGIINKAAVTSNGSDIIAASANIYATGDQNLTGSMQAAYVTLPDPANAQNETYLWANSNQLLWQINGSPLPQTPLNISQAVLNQAVDSTGYTLPTGPADLAGCVTALTQLLTMFASRGIFVNLNPGVPMITFNTPCAIQFNIYQSAVIVASPTYSFSIGTVFLNTLCTDITLVLGIYGSMIYSATQLTATLQPAPGYAISIADINFLGEAKRFINHLGFTGSLITPGTQYALPVTGISFLSNTPNTDNALAAPTPLTISAVTSGSVIVTITPPSTAGLTPPNVLQYYGIYLNGTLLSNGVTLLPSSSTSYTILFPPSPSPVLQTVNVYALDWYNQSPVATTTFTPPAPPIPWPPALYQNGLNINGVNTTLGGDFLNPLIPYAGGNTSAINNTYVFTIIPHTDLINICLRVDVDDGTVITFTGLQPTTSYPGAPSPPAQLVNIPGPQPWSGWGGVVQYSQPITLLGNQLYTVTMTYYNVSGSVHFYSLNYVTPGAPGSATAWTPTVPPGQNFYARPALDPLAAQNMSQYCFYHI